jgi:hypothetical protein
MGWQVKNIVLWEENIQHRENSESFKSRILMTG